ncbi:squalene--hopene cyclase [Paenibacillus protaetiae]|uniref:Squalene--hopene cyclase n=1 Tax=Paenibacillus protaetiae TaxID=2509456 RepID=A0A4V0YEZ6_9BACL|nr:squalene--hopene cyclase [Paenibacillus protaetiae]QAY65941.1 squalene--hopene cyclase [Paenibacillus protaetiae]
MTIDHELREGIAWMSRRLLAQQHSDGSWRFPFDSGTSPDAYLLIVLRTLEIDNEPLLRKLHDRLRSAQQPDGSWKVYPDEEQGNLAATVDAYYALLYSGFSHAGDEQMQLAKQFISEQGGLRKVDSVLTKAFLAATGQYPWPASLVLPIEVLLFPNHFPVNLYDFSSYARVHFIPILLLADRRFSVTTPISPDLSELSATRSELTWEWRPSGDGSRPMDTWVDSLKQAAGSLAGYPAQLREDARRKAERYMLDRIEPDGTLYSYGTATLLMILALLSLGYDKRHPVIMHAVDGLLRTLAVTDDGAYTFMQNTPSAVWDTALLSHALQEAGVPADHPAIQNASAYLLGKQQYKRTDWAVHNPIDIAGGWGFSDSNTLNPDVDDTTAALRAIHRLAAKDEHHTDAWNRGLNWILSMQNKDGGWAAFEKDTDKEWLSWLPIHGARDVATDPSTADLTGRTLEFLGSAGLNHERFACIRRGTEWLMRHQEKDGSWYGRWGICYIYGTWAALTGLSAAGTIPQHPSVQRAVGWLLSIQNEDGGWGESCSSDVKRHYVPLGASIPSQTAWALDALIAVHPRPTSAIDKGIRLLLDMVRSPHGWTSHYPTGGGLPGLFYSDYYSYKSIWPLLALARYQKKYLHS